MNCYFHSSKEAKYRCRQCEKDICQSCTIQVEGEPFCQICWDGYVARIRDLNEQKEVEQTPIPWQRWRELGPTKAFLETAGQVVFQPSRFFSHFPTGKEFLTPMLFAGICILVFWFPMNILYIKWIFPSILPAVSEENTLSESHEPASSPGAAHQDIRQRLVSISYSEMLTMPLTFVLYNVFMASILQQLLIQFFQGREGYIATLQIRCYAMIAELFLIIPIIGIFLAPLSSLFMCTRGFQVVQKLTLPQALCVAVVPIMIAIVPVFAAVVSMLFSV